MANQPIDQVLAELADTMMPHPDEYLDTYTPGAAFMLGRQVYMACLLIAAGASALLAQDDGDNQPVANEVLNGVAMAVAGFTHALVTLDILPKEAEEALAAPLAPPAK